MIVGNTWRFLNCTFRLFYNKRKEFIVINAVKNIFVFRLVKNKFNKFSACAIRCCFSLHMARLNLYKRHYSKKIRLFWKILKFFFQILINSIYNINRHFYILMYVRTYIFIYNYCIKNCAQNWWNYMWIKGSDHCIQLQ